MKIQRIEKTQAGKASAFIKKNLIAIGLLTDPILDFDLQDLFKFFKPPSFLLVASDGERIIGTCGIKDRSVNRAELRRFYVDKNFRSKGIGKMLLFRSYSGESHLKIKIYV